MMVNLLEYFAGTLTVRDAAKQLGISKTVAHRIYSMGKLGIRISTLLGTILNVNQQLLNAKQPPLEFTVDEMASLDFLQDYVNTCMAYEVKENG